MKLERKSYPESHSTQTVYRRTIEILQGARIFKVNCYLNVRDKTPEKTMLRAINITAIPQCCRIIGMYLGSPYNKRKMCSIIYQVNVLVITACISSL